MAALMARLEALEALANVGSGLCHVELIAHDDPRAAGLPLNSEGRGCVTRIFLVPLQPLHLAAKGATHGNA